MQKKDNKTTTERVHLLEQARCNLEEAVHLIYEAFDESEHSRLSSYICGHLITWANGHNPYESTSIPRLIDQVLDEGAEHDNL